MSEWFVRNTAHLIRSGVLEIGDGYRAKNSEFVYEGGLPFLRVGNVGPSTLELDRLDELPMGERRRYEPKVSRPSDSLITMKGTIGRVAFVRPTMRPFVYSPQISYWRSLDEHELHPRWLRYWLEGPEFVRQAASAKGATDMADYINLRDQRRMQITIPPPKVQRRIAQTLGALDDLIDNNRRRIQILEEIAKAIYREWFVRFRYPGHEADIMVDTPLGRLPDGWKVTTLGEVSENFDRLRKPLSKIRRSEMQGDYPYYGAAKIVDYVNDWIFDGEYLLFAEDGTVTTPDGYPVLQLVNEKFWVNNHTHVLRGTVLPTRLLWLAVADYPLTGHVTGAAQPKVTQANLNRVRVVKPASEVVDAFARAVDPLVDMLQHLARPTDVLSEIRDLLLPRLVTGQIDVSSLNLDAVVGASA